MFGTVVVWKPERGFGFVRVNDQPADIFFHVSEFKGDEAQIIKGALVELRLGEYKGKPVARDLQLLQAASDDSPPGSAYASQRAVRAVLGGAR